MINNVYVVRDKNYENAVLFNKLTNEVFILTEDNAKKIECWIEDYQKGRLLPNEEAGLLDFCNKHFETRHFTNSVSTMHMNITKKIAELRLMIQLGCNLKCNYCYAVEGTYRRETNSVMTDEMGIAILDSIVEKGIRQIEHISFFGGEPTVYWETIRTVCKHAKTLHENGGLEIMPEFFIVTNGTILTDGLLETIKEFNIKMTISLDGPKEINDKLRVDKNGKGTYDTILSNLNKMKAYGVLPQMIETTYTCVHEEMGLERFEIVNTIKEITGVSMVMIADCIDSYLSPINKESLNSSTNMILQAIRNVFAGDIKTPLELNALCLTASVIRQLFNKKVRNDVHCSSGYRSLCVDGNGDYYPCHRYVETPEYKLGNLILDNEIKIKRSLTKDAVPKCSKCWAAQFCSSCTWEMLKDLDTQLEICEQRKTLYKHIVMEFINSEPRIKEVLFENMHKEKLIKQIPIINQ